MDADSYNWLLDAVNDADSKKRPTLSRVGHFVTSVREANRSAVLVFREVPDNRSTTPWRSVDGDRPPAAGLCEPGRAGCA